MQQDEFEIRQFPSIQSVGLSDKSNPIRVCIVTEEIIGPVRNGGIASTYYHLSKGLAAHGHDVHVLFLKGPVVQDETPEHWVEHFASFGVTLHYLEVPKGARFGVATGWQDKFMAAYRWLRDQDPFDVVHTSEWRGGMIYALMAKRMGLAFQETLFLVKTSSPHIWNRHYQMQPIEKRDLAAAAYAEQKCVELADMVIGGSAHLITFMGEIGYRLPPANVFVQPNIVDFSKVPVTDQRGSRAPGDVVKTRDIIFFGRLEGRKGVELFCNALDILRERGVVPDHVTFMGKWGAPLATQGGMAVEDYIAMKSSAWECPVEIITDKNQPEALSHMCSRDMIAVMPSLIENSTMAVYETLEKRIPFIATATGGTPELIAPEDHATSLVAPRAQDLADRIEAALRDGQPIAHPSFSNDENLEVWYGFHNFVGARIAEKGRRAAVTELTAPLDAATGSGAPVQTIAWVSLIRRGDHPEALARALAEEKPDKVVLAVTEASLRPAAQAASQQLLQAGVAVELMDNIGLAAGEALDAAARSAGTDALVLSDGTGVQPAPGCFAAVRAALSQRPEDFVTAFATGPDDTLVMPLGGDTASQFFSSRAYGPECVALTTRRLEQLGRVEPYDLRHGLIHEYTSRNVARGQDLMVIPEPLLTWPDMAEFERSTRQDGLHAYLQAKPLIDEASLPLRKILLAGLLGQSGGAVSESLLRDGSRGEDAAVWLMPVDWNREDHVAAGRHRMAVAIDETENRLWLLARGPGLRTFMVSNTPQHVTEVEAPAEGSELSIATYDIPEAWEVGASYPIRWELDQSADGLRTRFLRITKIGANTYALAARKPVLSKAAFDRLVVQHKAADDMISGLDLADFEGDTDGLDSLSAETRDIIAEAGMEMRKDGGKPARLRARGAVEAASIDDLLALAYDTGRGGLERKMALEKSATLLAALPEEDAASLVDLRSGLILPDDRCWSRGHWIEGWAWDRAVPSRSLTVVLSKDGTDLVAVVAGTRIDRLTRRTPELEKHGFRLPVPAALFDGAADGGSPAISLRVAESGALIRGGQLALLDEKTLGPAPDAAEDAAGALARSDALLADLGTDPSAWPSASDGADIRSGILSPKLSYRGEGAWIEGWAWDRQNPDKTLHVAVFQDGQPVLVAASATLITSLGIRTPGLECHGFRIPVLARFLDAPLELRIVETAASVKNGGFLPAEGPAGTRGLAPASDP